MIQPKHTTNGAALESTVPQSSAPPVAPSTPATRSASAPSALRLLEELPGIDDVVWTTVTRLASVPIPTTVLFTAAEKRAGTTVLASATAIGLAQHLRASVCLLEANVARPSVAGWLGLTGMGLSDVLDGRAHLESCLQEPEDCPGLLVLPAGTPRAPVPGEYATERLGEILKELEQRCQYLVIDAPPVLEHVESRLLLRRADAVVLVLRARATRKCDAERAHDVLLDSGTLVLGSIFNAYKTESLFGWNGHADRSYERAVRAERSHARDRAFLLATGALHDEAPVPTTPTSELAEPTASDRLGSDVLVPHSSLAPADEAAYRRQIELLERRVTKLNRLLEQTEADLQRIAAAKGMDEGIASVYRGVQGLSEHDGAIAFKRTLMREIFQANLDLRTAMARHP